MGRCEFMELRGLRGRGFSGVWKWRWQGVRGGGDEGRWVVEGEVRMGEVVGKGEEWEWKVGMVGLMG